MENRISIVIPEDVRSAVVTKLDEIGTLLRPYIATVTDEQKKSLLKIGDKTLPFVSKALEYAGGSGSGYVPTYLDITEFGKDVNASDQLSGIIRRLDQLYQTVEDTQSLTANDAYSEALAYYNSVKNAAKVGEANAKTIYDDLSQRFPGRPSAKSTETTTK